MEKAHPLPPMPLRDRISQGLVSLGKPIYYFLRKKCKPWKIQQAELQHFPNGSLGHDLYLFLKENNLTLMPIAEFHDVYHVLFELDTSMKSETCIQFVPLGNGQRSAPILVSTAISALFYPENWSDFYSAYQKGKNAPRFYDWDFEKLLAVNARQLRQLLFGKG